jgi:hypothetical protein
MLAFIGPPAGVRLTGKAGEWWVSPEPSYTAGRFARGSDCLPTLGAADLGRLSQRQPILPATGTAPAGTGLRVTEDGQALSAETSIAQMWSCYSEVPLVDRRLLTSSGSAFTNLKRRLCGPHPADPEAKLVLRATSRRIPTAELALRR